MQNNTIILDFEQCEQIGIRAEDKVFNSVVLKLNDRYPSSSGLSYFDQLSIDSIQSENILSQSNPETYKEIVELMKEVYRTLNEFEQHCLFVYLFTNEIDEDEIVESMVFHFEEWMEERAYNFLNLAKDKNGLSN